MASGLPIIRQFARPAVIPHSILVMAFIFAFSLLNAGSPLLYGALVYIILALALRRLVPRDHRRGIKLVKQEKFAEAISSFEKSVEFFRRNSWVDKFRYLTILSSSQMSFREMGLCNIAFCYHKIGEGAKAIEFYRRALDTYPESGLAKAALRRLGSVSEG